MQQNLSSVVIGESEKFCTQYDFNTVECNLNKLNRPITSEEIGQFIQKITRQQSEEQPYPPPQNSMTLKKCELDFEFAYCYIFEFA